MAEHRARVALDREVAEGNDAVSLVLSIDDEETANCVLAHELDGSIETIVR